MQLCMIEQQQHETLLTAQQSLRYFIACKTLNGTTETWLFHSAAQETLYNGTTETWLFHSAVYPRVSLPFCASIGQFLCNV